MRAYRGEQPRPVRACDELVPRTGRDQRGVTDSDLSHVPVDLEATAAFREEVDLFAPAVVVARGRPTGTERGLGERLGRGVVELADRRAVLGREGFCVGERTEVHAGDATRLALRLASEPQRHRGQTQDAVARARTSSSILSVRRPVNVFCWLGW
jgi:hypothetical protein